MKKIIKAHKGFAHVPQPSSQQAPSKAKGTAGTTPRRRRMIGLPQRFRGSRGRAPMPQAPAPVRRAPVMQEPKVITQPKPVVRPPRQSDAGGGRGVRPVMELPNKGRRIIRRPKTPMAQPRILNQGGYMSRANYGIVDNLKGK